MLTHLQGPPTGAPTRLAALGAVKTRSLISTSLTAIEIPLQHPYGPMETRTRETLTRPMTMPAAPTGTTRQEHYRHSGVILSSPKEKPYLSWAVKPERPLRTGEPREALAGVGRLRDGPRRYAGVGARPAHHATARLTTHAAACASSLRRFSSACSPAVSSSSSPARTWSRLCTVSLMRWSVTRRSP